MMKQILFLMFLLNVFMSGTDDEADFIFNVFLILLQILDS